MGNKCWALFEGNHLLEYNPPRGCIKLAPVAIGGPTRDSRNLFESHLLLALACFNFLYVTIDRRLPLCPSVVFLCSSSLPLFLPSRDEEMISIDHFQPELCSCARIQPRRRFKPDRVGGSVVRRRESRPRVRVAPIIIAILIELIMDSAARSSGERERGRGRGHFYHLFFIIKGHTTFVWRRHLKDHQLFVAIPELKTHFVDTILTCMYVSPHDTRELKN